MNLEPIHVGGDGADDPAGVDGAHRELLDLYNRIVWACHHEAAVVLIRERIRTFLGVRELALLPRGGVDARAALSGSRHPQGGS